VQCPSEAQNTSEINLLLRRFLLFTPENRERESKFGEFSVDYRAASRQIFDQIHPFLSKGLIENELKSFLQMKGLKTE